MMLSKNNTKNYWKYWPEKKTLTLKPKAFDSTTTDQFGADVPCKVCRKRSPTDDELLAAQIDVTVKSCIFEIWNFGQTAPNRGDTLLDTDGISWIVQRERKELFEQIFICTCIRDL